jgi:hypothetical protein
MNEPRLRRCATGDRSRPDRRSAVTLAALARRAVARKPINGGKLTLTLSLPSDRAEYLTTIHSRGEESRRAGGRDPGCGEAPTIGGEMTAFPQHRDLILDQFTRQAAPFSTSPYPG